MELLNRVREMSSSKMLVDKLKVLKYEDGDSHNNKADSFVVIDLESVSNNDGVDNNYGPSTLSNTTTSSNSRIILQRSLARKVPQHGIDRKFHAPPSSPKVSQAISNNPEKSLAHTTTPTGSHDHDSTNNNLPQHQITIITCDLNKVPEGRRGRRLSFKRSSSSWFDDPKRILLFFATMSSLGTMMLIFFTLSIYNCTEKGNVLDWQ